MARKVEHEITLIAMCRNEDGTRSIADIVETSNHFASKFVRGWMRDPLVTSIATCRPGTNLSECTERELGKSEG